MNYLDEKAIEQCLFDWAKSMTNGYLITPIQLRQVVIKYMDSSEWEKTKDDN